jgi:hypothetical protein
MASITIILNPAEADEFLRRLGEDESYRDRVRRDPSGALGEYGITVSEDLMPTLLSLPPKHVVQRLRSADPPPRPTSNRRLWRRIKPPPVDVSVDDAEGEGPPWAGDCTLHAVTLLAAAHAKPAK